jgi:hypothetical protein
MLRIRDPVFFLPRYSEPGYGIEKKQISELIFENFFSILNSLIRIRDLVNPSSGIRDGKTVLGSRIRGTGGGGGGDI